MVIGFLPGTARQRPYPFDAVISGVPVMLGLRDEEQTELVMTEAGDASQIAPTDYGFTGQNPFVERAQPYRRMSKGFGARVQKEFDDQRYSFALGADLSTEVWQKGPSVTTFTPATTDATNGVTRFVERATDLFAITGRYALIRSSDTSWTVSKDFGVGERALDAIAFAPNDGSGNTYLFVAMNGSTIAWYYNGTTWSQMASFTAVSFALVGREFYWFTSPNLARKVDVNADPTVETNYGAVNQFRIGDQQNAIVRATTTASGALLILKRDSIHSLDEAGDDVEYFRDQFRLGANANNGLAYTTFLNDVYTAYRGGVFKIALHVSFAVRLIGSWAGPELQNETNWLSSMRTTALLGHDSFFMLGAITDETDSYIMKMMPDGVWHGSITTAFTNRIIQHLFKSTIGAPTNRSRCYIGFSDGTLGWFTLSHTRNPAADTSAAFTTTNATIDLPLMTGVLATEPKTMFEAIVDNLNFSSTNYAQVGYRTDPTAAGFTDIGGNFTTAPMSSQQFGNNVAGVQPQFRVTLVSTATSGTPQMLGLGIRHAVRVNARKIYTMYVLTSDHLRARDGRPLRIGKSRIRSVVRAARAAQGAVTLIMSTEESQQVIVRGLEETVALDPYTGKYTGAVKMIAVQQNASLTLGTVARLAPYTVGNLLPYTVAYLSQI